MMVIQDILNNQFRLCDILHKLNIKLIEFAENNNVRTDYYCIVYQTSLDTIYIVTSNTIKNNENGWRLITININKSIYDTNCCLNHGNSTAIQYENISINIGPCTTDINNDIIHTGMSISVEKCEKFPTNGTIDSDYSYSPDVDELTISNVKYGKVQSTPDIKYYNNLKIIDIADVGFNINLLKMPSSVEKIWLGGVKDHYTARNRNFFYGATIQSNVLPLNLQTLIFGFNYNTKVNKDVLPLNLSTLIFGYCYNKPIDTDVLPLSLINLVFGYYFGSNYNQPFKIGVLPSSLKLLALSQDYNQKIDNGVLPPSLVKLLFTGCYTFKSKLRILPGGVSSKVHYIASGNECKIIDEHLFN
jgi:hypothetical protein